MKNQMRVGIALAFGLLILAGLNWNIFQRERLIEHGRTVLLPLAPVDPRSLMQGDYMALRFEVANKIGREIEKKYSSDGRAVVSLDQNNVASFVRMDDGKSPLLPGEVRLRYRVRGYSSDVKIATNAFFFEEGQGKVYEPARYGEFRVDAAGDAILTQLRDKDFQVLGRSAVLN
jgi:uncharacterized membrane-anchored protein